MNTTTIEIRRKDGIWYIACLLDGKEAYVFPFNEVNMPHQKLAMRDWLNGEIELFIK